MLTCPMARCRAANVASADVCVGCGTPLANYSRMVAHGAQLFNRGLAAAADHRMSEARDLFAAVVLWFPTDLVARNAYALACYCQSDKAAARRSWQAVLERSPRDERAIRGMLLLETPEPAAAAAPKHGKKQRKKSTKSKKKRK